MGHKHSKEQLLAGALAAALDEGLSRLTFGRVAKRLGVNDRMVVYYFPTKDDLIRQVLAALGLQLQGALAAAFQSKADDHLELVRPAWRVLATEEVDPAFALFFEANGLAAAGVEPYASFVPALVQGWIEWASGFVSGPAAKRRTEAEAGIALLDGLLLLRQLAGPEAASRAAKRMGVR